MRRKQEKERKKFRDDGHKHVTITNGKKTLYFTKGDHESKIWKLISRGWRIVERDD